MKIKLIIIFSFFSFSFIYSQSGSSYTRFGLGDVDYSYSARRIGMGQAGISLADFDFINSVNPAGLYKLSRTRLETGISYNGLIISDASENRYTGEAGFAGFSFGFPVSSLYGIGVALGLVPFSNVGYDVREIVESGEDEIGNYELNYSGKGGLSKLYIASSYKLPFNLIVGASLDYYFGSFNYITDLKFENTGLRESNYTRTYNPHGIGGTFGVISPDISALFNSENINDFRLGISINTFSEFSTDTSLILTDSFGSDTLISGATSINIPLRTGVGLSFVISSKYFFMLDYIYQPWGAFDFNNFSSVNLRNSTKYSLGFEYRPLRDLGLSLWEQIIFRAGLSFEQTPYLINGEGINQLSVAGGFSIPLGFENTIDIGLQYSTRGKAETGLLKEDIFKLNVGVSLGELWFIRQEN